LDQIGTIIDLLLLIVGPVAFIFAMVSYVRTVRFLRWSTEVAGEVVRLERSKDRDRYGYSYAPVFSFHAADGNEYTVTSNVGSSPPGFSVGESVRVRYDPANPEDARIHTFFQIWGVAIVFAAAGIMFFGIALYMLRYPPH
jgi:hypothetical protein